MASALQQAVTVILQSNYSTIAIFAAIGYDYILTFADEVEYIWNKPRTWVSILFFFARYFGLCSLTTTNLTGSSLPPGPTKFIFFLLYGWSTWVFMAAADFVMILRVWSLYSRSRFTLAALLPLYAAEVVVFLVSLVYSARNNQGTVVQVLDFSFCVPDLFSVVLLEAVDTIQLTLGTFMFLMISIRCIKESVQMYRATKQFRPSRYTSLLTGQSILAYLALLAYASINSIWSINAVAVIWLAVLQYVPAYTLVPRFILSLRALYAHDLQGGRGSEIDTAFGFASADRGVVRSNIVFADVGQNESERVEEIMMEEREVQSAGGAV